MKNIPCLFYLLKFKVSAHTEEVKVHSSLNLSYQLFLLLGPERPALRERHGDLQELLREALLLGLH